MNDLYLTTNNNKVYTYSVPISFGNSTGGSQPSSTVNLTNIPNYDKLTVEKNIFIKSFTYGSKWNDNGPSESYSPVLSYDSSTGIVTINNLGRGNLSTYGWVVTSMTLAVVA